MYKLASIAHGNQFVLVLKLKISQPTMIPAHHYTATVTCTSVDYMRSDKGLVIYLDPHATCHMQPRTRLIIIRREVRTMSLFQKPFPISPIFTAGTCAAQNDRIQIHFQEPGQWLCALVLGMRYNIRALDRRARLVISRLIEKFRVPGYRYVCIRSVSYLCAPYWRASESYYGLPCTQRLFGVFSRNCGDHPGNISFELHPRSNIVITLQRKLRINGHLTIGVTGGKGKKFWVVLWIPGTKSGRAGIDLYSCIYTLPYQS